MIWSVWSCAVCETTLRKTPASLPSHKRALKELYRLNGLEVSPVCWEKDRWPKWFSWGWVVWYVDTCDFVLSHFGSNVKGATHAGLGSNLVTKKGFSLFKWMLKKTQSVFIERNRPDNSGLWVLILNCVRGTKNEGTSGHASMWRHRTH